MKKEDFITLISEIFSSETLAPRKIKVLSIDDTFEETFEVSFVALDSEGNELPKRCFKVRQTFRQGWEVSHGIVSPTNVEADLIQNIIVGEVAKELLKINLDIK